MNEIQEVHIDDVVTDYGIILAGSANTDMRLAAIAHLDMTEY